MGIVDLPPSRRGVGIVFQNYALFPISAFAENVAYGLPARKWPREKGAQRDTDMLDLVQLNGFGTVAAGALRRPAAARRAGPLPGDRAL